MNTAQKAPRVLERRVKSLTYLAGATVLAVVLAIVTQWYRGASTQAEFKPVKAFPALEAQANDVSAIQVEAKTASFNVVKQANGKWILPDRGNFGADFNAIRKTVMGLASLELVEAKTSRAEWHDKLGLALPKAGGNGTVLTLKNAKGEVLASLVVGTAVEGASAGGKNAVYVRRPAENQTYVARGSLDLQSDQAEWLDKSFIDFPRDRIKTVSMKPFKGPSYTVTREKPETVNFSIVERIPSGRTLRSEAEPNGVGNALIGMSFTDVVTQSQIDFSKPARATFQTFDGMALNVMIVQKDNDFWLAFDAVEIPPAIAPAADAKLKPNIPQEVAELNALAQGRAFKIAQFKGTLLTTPLEAMLNVPGAPR